MEQRRIRLDLPAGPIRGRVTASQADTAWLGRGRTVSAAAPQQKPQGEITDEEADMLWPPRTRAEAERRLRIAAAAQAAQTDDDVYDAIFGGES
jgi:hypothetical protein